MKGLRLIFASACLGAAIASASLGSADNSQEKIVLDEEEDFSRICEDEPINMTLGDFIALYGIARKLDEDNGVPHYVDMEEHDIHLRGEPGEAPPRYIVLKIKDGDTAEAATESYVLYDTRQRAVPEDGGGYHLPPKNTPMKNILCYIPRKVYERIRNGSQPTPEP